jgi:ABC-type Fe3+/spermidine/putrescine transport system ATPase subunit
MKKELLIQLEKENLELKYRALKTLRSLSSVMKYTNQNWTPEQRKAYEMAITILSHNDITIKNVYTPDDLDFAKN